MFRSYREWKGARIEMENSDMDISKTSVFIPHKQRLCFFKSYDLSTKRGQNAQMLKIIFLAIIPVFVLLIQSSIYISNDSKVVSQQKSVRDNILFSVEIGLLVHYLQLERGATALYISSGGSNLVLTSLESNRLKTDTTLDSLTKWISVTRPTHFRTREAYRVRLRDYREKLEPANTTIHAAIEFYSNDNDIMIGWVGLTVKDSDSETTWQELTAYHMLLLSKEQAGIERAIGSTFFTRGSFSVEELLWYTEKKILGATYLERSMQYSSFVRTILDDQFTNTPLSTELVMMRQKIITNNASLASVTAGIVWFHNMTQYINILKDIQDGLAQEIIRSLADHITSLQKSLILNVIEIVGVVIMSPIIVYLVYRLTKKLQSFAASLKNKTADLEIERKRSEQLLYQMLPIAIAKRMMKDMAIHPEHYDSVTIYFSDIVGFTTICSKSSPMQVINMLNILYIMIDDRLESFDVYKVETIGDAYMVASGLPIRNKDRHVLEIAMMSLDIMTVVNQATVPHIPEEQWKLRIGINTGSVVAGVVGTKMPRYCLFGDTVNVASRMESTSKPCMIQMSPSTKTALEKFPHLLIRERGEMPIKGKGMMTTYWLIGHQHGYRCSAAEKVLYEPDSKLCHLANV